VRGSKQTTNNKNQNALPSCLFATVGRHRRSLRGRVPADPARRGPWTPVTVTARCSTGTVPRGQRAGQVTAKRQDPDRDLAPGGADERVFTSRRRAQPKGQTSRPRCLTHPPLENSGGEAVTRSPSSTERNQVAMGSRAMLSRTKPVRPTWTRMFEHEVGGDNRFRVAEDFKPRAPARSASGRRGRCVQ